MEKMEQDEAQEIFQECDNAFATKEYKNSFSELNLEDTKFATEKDPQGNIQNSINYKLANNNHHIVYVGIIMVSLTIYLGMTGVHKCLVNCVENTSVTEQLQQLQEAETLENTQVLERFLEYKDICKDLEIFTKDIKQKQHKKQMNEEESHSDEVNTNASLKDVEVSSGGIEEDSGVEHEDSSSGSSGNGDCAKANRNKPKKSKYSIKTTSTKNGFNKYNKSTKAKYQKNEKKDLNLNKKNSTAEPIIYLFALVFIYLLLKAASDINQHYKSQNKNDKRLRRCSLQSYAQTHRPDRRASKGISTKSLPKF